MNWPFISAVAVNSEGTESRSFLIFPDFPFKDTEVNFRTFIFYYFV